MEYEEDKVPKKDDIASPEKLSIYHHPSIIILDKNWDPSEKDSLLNKEDISPAVSVSDSDILQFITTAGDTIEYQKKQIRSKNPIIIFSPDDGPVLTSLEKFTKLYHFYFPPETDTVIIIKKEEKKTDEITKAPQEIEIIERETIDGITSISTFPYFEIEKKDTLRKKAQIDIYPENLSYPIINNNQALLIRFDNDFWDYTDYYYTNGAAIGYTHPIFASSPVSRLLVSNGNSGIDYYGLQVVQHMYTGLQPKVDTIVQGDRPWSAYTTIGQYLTSYDIQHKIKHYSEFNIGLIGRESGGGFVQNFVHVILPNNSAPKGWDNQIATDIIIDYQYKILKEFYSANHFESYLTGSAQAGTLRDNVGWGFGLRYGKFIPFYQDVSIYHRKRKTAPYARKFRYNLVFNIETRLIGYDATLQGGMFNKESVYVLPSASLNRFVLESYAGFEVSFGQWELQFLQYWKSREFHTGEDHKYVSVKLNVAF